MTAMPIRARAAVAAALLFLAAAPGGAQTTEPIGPLGCDGACTAQVEVRFLGAGGFLVRHGEDAVLTGPLFSNPPLRRVVLPRAVRADTAVIDRQMRAFLPDTHGIRAILVGHSHYDHLMDVPHVARRHVPGVPIYGNETMRNLLASERDLVPRLVALEPFAGTASAPGRWIYPKAEGPAPARARRDSTVRIMAIGSEHAPHALGLVKLYRRHQTTPRSNLPENAWQWAEGNAHAFVIEFMDTDGDTLATRARVYYTDTSARPPFGVPPALPGRFDVALLCAGNYDQVAGGEHPRGLLRALRPRHAIIGHWEDFFQPQTEPVRKIPLLELGEFFWRVRQHVANPVLPMPGQSVRLCACGPGAAA